MDTIFLKSLFPEIFLSLAILFQLLCNSRLINSYKFNYPLINVEILWQGIFILLCTFLLLLNQYLDTYMVNMLFISDLSTRNIKIMVLFFSILSFVFIWKGFVIQKINFFEYFSLYFLSLLGTLLLVSTFDLISAYLVIELQALSFYILACFNRTSSFSTEAGLKYFILGSFISGILLLGSFVIYASLGTLNFNAISLLMFTPLTGDLSFINFSVLIGSTLVVVAILFKLAIAPFHFWAPDVYEGSPLPSTIIFSVLPKLALITFFMRWISMFIFNYVFLKVILVLTGLLSVLWGAYLAITQKRLKRFIIYSSISQMGFVIVALSVCLYESYSSIFFFLSVYLVSSILIWGSVIGLYSIQNKIYYFNNVKSVSSIFLADLSGLYRLNYSWSLLLMLLFFSFAGIPPLGGFLAKVFIIMSLLIDNNVVVTMCLITISIISTYYYLRIIKIIFFDKKDYFETSKKFIIIPSYTLGIECTLLTFCVFLLIFIFFFPTVFALVSSSLTFGCNLV